MVVGSNPVDGSILYTQIRNHPSSLSCVLAVAPTMKRSAAQPKTTRLCSSIIVISLWSPAKSVMVGEITDYLPWVGGDSKNYQKRDSE